MHSEAEAVHGKIRPSARSQADAWRTSAIDAGDFTAYQLGIIHDWLRTLTWLSAVLVPLFFALDIFMMPAGLLPRFAVYRLISTLLALGQALIVRHTRPSRWSYLHGYFISLQVGGIIALMTVDLGGFTSSYYAGLNLVIIGVNLLMPWRAEHTGINTLLILAMYMTFNLVSPHDSPPAAVVNNLFFLCATGVVAVAINYVRHGLIRKEFTLLVELKGARDALWGEMELAKRIQTALLPQRRGVLRGFEVAVSMIPAREVGGDYYDIIETGNGDRWIAIGDVAGHGVDSGLIMMMAQASIMTAIKGTPRIGPREVLATTNRVLREDIARLGSNHYMTMMVIQMADDHLLVAGHHQDMLIYRAAESRVTAVPTTGTWLGITDDIEPFLSATRLELAEGDTMLLFTDGVTEAADADGEMFGQERLARALELCGDLAVEKTLQRILDEVRAFQADQKDDMTLILLKKTRRRPEDEGGAHDGAPHA
ncbi:MAG TPA: SpoIIE family protein phosphatase [Spirochaetia bacterium]|nr:SpoIIE family protein phosphatase [Spirochaetia bacterium]